MGRTAGLSFLLTFLLAGCAASVQTVNEETYRQSSFTEEMLDEGGLAILPIVAGQGVEGYRRPFGRTVNQTAEQLLGAEDVLRWQSTMDQLNSQGLATSYNEAVATYQRTSIIDQSLVERMGNACNRRYFLYIRLSPPKNVQRQAESDINEGGSYQQQYIGVGAFGQIWDARTGDVVWEGTGMSSVARKAELTYIKDKDINTYSQNAARALVRGLFGLPATGGSSQTAQDQSQQTKAESQTSPKSPSRSANSEAREQKNSDRPVRGAQEKQEVGQRAERSAVDGDSSHASSKKEKTSPGQGGDDVAWVQRTLNELGYECGVVDGLMGPTTRSCIRAFQEANGLAVTGVVNETTYGEILARVQPKREKQTKTQSQPEARNDPSGSQAQPQTEPEEEKTPRAQPDRGASQPESSRARMQSRRYQQPRTGLGVRLGRDVNDIEKFSLGIDAQYHTPNLPVALYPSLDYYYLGEASSTNFFTSVSVRVHILQVGGNVLYPFRTEESSLEPYVGGGLAFNFLIAEAEASSAFGGTGSASETEVGLGINLLGGVNYRINRKMQLFFEAQYTPGTGAGGAGELNFFALKSGLRFGL